MPAPATKKHGHGIRLRDVGLGRLSPLSSYPYYTREPTISCVGRASRSQRSGSRERHKEEPERSPRDPEIPSLSTFGTVLLPYLCPARFLSSGYLPSRSGGKLPLGAWFSRSGIIPGQLSDGRNRFLQTAKFLPCASSCCSQLREHAIQINHCSPFFIVNSMRSIAGNRLFLLELEPAFILVPFEKCS
jgi:hypothetical protein